MTLLLAFLHFLLINYAPSILISNEHLSKTFFILTNTTVDSLVLVFIICLQQCIASPKFLSSKGKVDIKQDTTSHAWRRGLELLTRLSSSFKLYRLQLSMRGLLTVYFVSAQTIQYMYRSIRVISPCQIALYSKMPMGNGAAAQIWNGDVNTHIFLIRFTTSLNPIPQSCI